MEKHIKERLLDDNVDESSNNATNTMKERDQGSPHITHSEDEDESGSKDYKTPLKKGVHDKKRVCFQPDENNEVFWIDPEDNPMNDSTFYKVKNLFLATYPVMLTKLLSNLPQFMVLYSIGHQTNPLNENIYESYFLGHSIMYFWCVLPIRGLNR